MKRLSHSLTSKRRTSMKYLLSLLVLLSCPESIRSVPDIEDYNQKCYAHQRDVNILLSMGMSYDFSGRGVINCNPVQPLYSTGPMDYVEAFRYEIDKVNMDTNLLPNTSLGFIVVDDCHQDLASLIISVLTAPDPNDPEMFPDDQPITCEDGYKRFSNIIGAIGPFQSRQAVMVGGLSTIFKLPTLFPWASGDELSDKARYTYTARLGSPGRFGAEAMIDLMVSLGWNYASLLYVEGAFGEGGAKQVERQAKEKGVCLAFTFMFPSKPTKADAEDAAKKLWAYRKARVIVTYIYTTHLKLLKPFLDKYGIADNFFWIGTDLFPLGAAHGDMVDGGIIFDTSFGHDDDYRAFYQTLTPRNRADNPWFPYFWELVHGCQWNASFGNESCQAVIDKPHGIVVSGEEGILMDGVEVLATSLHRLITHRCPEAFGNRSQIRECLNGPALYQEILKTDLEGHIGKIKFDDRGDLLGKFVYKQYNALLDEIQIIGDWDKATGSMSIYRDKLSWLALKRNKTYPGEIPDGVCSKPCNFDEYAIQRELKCCWECRKCRENEIIRNKSSCEACPPYAWPDKNLTVCEAIEPDTLKWSSPISIGLATIAGMGTVGCLVVSIVFIKNRKVKLIKASSWESMVIIMTGILIAYLSVFAFLVRPSTFNCNLRYFGFNMSVTLIYAPLLLKTSRIFTIFRAGKKGTQRPRFTSSRAQLLFVLIIILIQMIVCIVSAIEVQTLPRLHMQVPTIKYVEILCTSELRGFLPPLCFNLLLIFTCAVFGFLTRKLPENFNESWYIFVSVATTTFLWLVFLPAYFTATYAVNRAVILCSCLLINSTISLLCLYLPKIYCIYFVDESDVKFAITGIGVTQVGGTGTRMESQRTQQTS